MKIVVPLDLSEVAEKAIEPAADIARGVGDQLLLVTVSGARLRHDLRSHAESEGTEIPELIEQYLESTAAELSGVDVAWRVINGETAAGALVDFADGEDDLRMIVMATHGRTGVERWRLGNVTEKSGPSLHQAGPGDTNPQEGLRRFSRELDPYPGPTT